VVELVRVILAGAVLRPLFIEASLLELTFPSLTGRKVSRGVRSVEAQTSLLCLVPLYEVVLQDTKVSHRVDAFLILLQGLIQHMEMRASPPHAGRNLEEARAVSLFVQ